MEAQPCDGKGGDTAARGSAGESAAIAAAARGVARLARSPTRPGSRGGGYDGVRRVISVISGGAPSRIGGPQKPVPRLT